MQRNPFLPYCSVHPQAPQARHNLFLRTTCARVTYKQHIAKPNRLLPLSQDIAARADRAIKAKAAQLSMHAHSEGSTMLQPVEATIENAEMANNGAPSLHGNSDATASTATDSTDTHKLSAVPESRTGAAGSGEAPASSSAGKQKNVGGEPSNGKQSP
eukprot:4559904-Pleurochrysis_carterae.AAC.4